MLYDFRYEWNKRKEKFKLWFVWNLPKWVVYWCVIRVWAYVTCDEYSDRSPDEVSLSEALKSWEKQ